MNDVKVVKVGHGFFDVFMGMGWRNTFRIRVVKGVIICPPKVTIAPHVKDTITKAIKEGKTKFSNFVNNRVNKGE